MANESNAPATTTQPANVRTVLPATYSYDQSTFAYNQPDEYEQKVNVDCSDTKHVRMVDGIQCC